MIIDSRHTQQLPISDRAVQFGDGCFSTILINEGKPVFWPEHLARLQRDCQRLSINKVDWDGLNKTTLQVASERTRAVLKVIISRGISQRGYGTQGIDQATVIVTSSEYPSHYVNWQKEGIDLGVCSIRLAQQPILAGLKHLNRLEQVLIKQEIENSPFADMLVMDTQGYLVESGAANLFWSKLGVWFTPSLDNSGIEGVMRNQLVNFLRKEKDGVTFGQWQPEVLQDADAVFICNSLMQIVPVRSVTLPTGELQFSISIVNALQSQVFSTITPQL